MKRAAAIGLLLACTCALADEGRAQVEQRIRLTARLIADSPTAQRIAASGNREAVSHLDEGRLHQARAEEAFKGGDLAEARRAVEHALHHLGMARRLVPDAPARQAAARARFEQMVASLDRLVESWRSRSVATGGTDNDLLEATARLGNARFLGEQGRHEEANQVLAAIEPMVLAGMTRALGSREIDYTARASTPAEEFQLELARHQSMADLVPIALRDLQPAPEAVALIERYGESSKALRAQALAAHQSGDTRQALSHIRSATLFLQRALGAAGVVTPTSTGN